MAAVNVNGHAIDVTINRLSGREHLSYDGQDVSRKRNLRMVTHSFSVDEDGRDVAYEVDTRNEIFMSAVSAVRRDGKTVYPV